MSFWSWMSLLRLPAAEHSAAVQRSRLGTVAVEIARKEIGQGETIANNVGPRIDVYRRGGSGGAWCAAGLSWVIEEACDEIVRRSGSVVTDPTLALIRERVRNHGAKKFFSNCLRCGAVRVETPLAGDIALHHRGAKGAWTGHVFLVSRDWEERGNTYWGIEFNRGGFPSLVDDFKHVLGEANELGFCRFP
jgi:hypothetical protein